MISVSPSRKTWLLWAAISLELHKFSSSSNSDSAGSWRGRTVAKYEWLALWCFICRKHSSFMDKYFLVMDSKARWVVSRISKKEELSCVMSSTVCR